MNNIKHESEILLPIIKVLKEELYRFTNKKRINKTDVIETFETILNSVITHESFLYFNQDKKRVVDYYKHGLVHYYTEEDERKSSEVYGNK